MNLIINVEIKKALKSATMYLFSQLYYSLYFLLTKVLFYIKYTPDSLILKHVLAVTLLHHLTCSVFIMHWCLLVSPAAQSHSAWCLHQLGACLLSCITQLPLAPAIYVHHKTNNYSYCALLRVICLKMKNCHRSVNLKSILSVCTM